MKRRLSQLLIAILITAAASLLLFGPRAHEQVVPGRVRIQYWEKWVGHEADQIREIVDSFNNTVGKEKGIWVDLVTMAQIEKKTLISTAAGVPPDVAGLYDTQLCQFASKGALLPLENLADARGMDRRYFKKVFYDGCSYQSHLYAMPSTPWAPALLWNKQIFSDHSTDLRAAGLDPDRPPATIDELDRYAKALDTWEEDSNGQRHLKLAGYIPHEPGWWINQTVYWFGAPLADETGTHLRLTSPEMLATFDWIRSYSERLGAGELSGFRSGFGTFDSPQNAFLSGRVAMVMQGPWMYSFIERYNPSMNRWHMSDEDARRAPNLPARERQKFCQWGVAAFPSAKPGLTDVTYAGTDILVIPSSSKHQAEAFEFLAFVNRQDRTERLNMLHGSLSPLTNVSRSFLEQHPNPYIDVFERLVSSPNAHPVPALPTWPQLSDEIIQAAQSAALLQVPSKDLLEQLQRRAQGELDRARVE